MLFFLFVNLLIFMMILAHDSIMQSTLYAIACPFRPSVRLSHGWISQKRLKIGLCNFHHTVVPSIIVSNSLTLLLFFSVLLVCICWSINLTARQLFSI